MSPNKVILKLTLERGEQEVQAGTLLFPMVMMPLLLPSYR
jgi:hypothetical protein